MTKNISTNIYYFGIFIAQILIHIYKLLHRMFKLQSGNIPGGSWQRASQMHRFGKIQPIWNIAVQFFFSLTITFLSYLIEYDNDINLLLYNTILKKNLMILFILVLLLRRINIYYWLTHHSIILQNAVLPFSNYMCILPFNFVSSKSNITNTTLWPAQQSIREN